MNKLLTMIGIVCICTNAFADADENGVTPYYWYKLDGNTNSYGVAASKIKWQGSTYVGSRNGKAILSDYTHYTSGGTLELGDGSWSLVCTARLPGSNVTGSGIVIRNFPIFSVGHGGYDGIAIVRTGYNAVKLMTFSGGTGANNSATAIEYSSEIEIPALVGRFHNFILTVVDDNGTTTANLYADGEWKARIACPFVRLPQKPYAQLGGIYGGGSLINTGNQVAYDDFRLYHQVLTSSQISSIASTFAPWPCDENGSWPDYWFKFDGNTHQIGSRFLNMKRTNGDLALVDSFNEGKALTFNLAMWSNGQSMHPSDDGNFTVSIVAKALAAANKIMWCAMLPSPLLLVSSDTGVKLVMFDGGVNGEEVVLFEPDVLRATTQFHHYAIKVDQANGRIHFYIDGSEIGTGRDWTASAATGSYNMQFGEANYWSSRPPSGYENGKQTPIDDFRLYSCLLTDIEIAGVAASFPPWPGYDTLGETPCYWMPFNGNLNQFGAVNAPFSWTGYEFTTMGADSVASSTGMRSVTGMNPWTPNASTGLSFGETNWTVAATVKVTPNNSGDSVVLSLGRSGDLDGLFYLMWESGSVVLYNFKDGDETVTEVIRSSRQVSESRFHHYVIVCDSGTKMYLYIDGAKSGEGNVACSQTAYQAQLNKAYNATVPTFTSYSSNNIFDDWRAYGRVLSEQEIAKIAKDEFGIYLRGLVISFY